MYVRLRNGTEVSIRPIRPADKTMLATALTRLSPDSARARFLTPKPSLSATELRYLTEVDGEEHYALVAVRRTDPTQIVAVARYVRLPEDRTTAEMAVVVADAMQGQGLGRRLGLQLADRARSRGVRRFLGLMLSDNVAAHRLFATISSRLSTSHHHTGVDELLADLAA